MEEKYKKRISWKEECEMFTVLLPEETGLPVSIYLDDGYAARGNGHPVVLFVQNSYNHYDDTFRHLICMTADERTENVFDTKLRIFYEDYVKVRLWVFDNQELIRALSFREIDEYDFLRSLKEKSNIHKKRFVAESVQHLNEMATLDGHLFGLPYAIWIDNTKTWKSSGHAPRIKVQTTSHSKKTTSWNPFILSELKFAKNAKDAEKYSAKDVSLIKKFVEANIDFITKVTCDENKSYTLEEIINGLLTIEEIESNKTKEDRNVGIRKLVYSQTLNASSGSYIIVEDINIKKYSLVSKSTGENVLNDQWFDAVLPTIKQINGKDYVAVWNNEEVIYIEIII